MKSKLSFVLAAVLLTLFVSALIAQESHTYVGVKTCKMCHKGEAKSMVFEKWEASKHAQAAAVLQGKEVTDKCYGCHATGFGKPTGFKSDSLATVLLAGVQCEACHGPGSDYKKINVMKDRKLAVQAGLIIPNAESCTQCHNTLHHKDLIFDYKTAWPQIAHSIKKSQ